jgi:hypothetical protein
MTTPSERTRSLRYAYEFLTEVSALEDLPPEFRKNALTILRHYPSPREIKDAANVSDRSAIVEPWLKPED